MEAVICLLVMSCWTSLRLTVGETLTGAAGQCSLSPDGLARVAVPAVAAGWEAPATLNSVSIFQFLFSLNELHLCAAR